MRLKFLRLGLFAAVAVPVLFAVAEKGRGGTLGAQGTTAGDRLLRGAIDIHLHIDARTYGADISTLKLAKAEGRPWHGHQESL